MDNVASPDQLPVPDSRTVSGELVALLAIAKIALRAPVAAGVKLTDTLQLALAAKLFPHVLATMEKYAGFVPPIPTLEIDRVALPVLVRVTVCERDVIPTVSGEYVKVVVESETTGIPPAPLEE